MEVSVEKVRLLFSIDQIADVAVAANILYLGVAPRTLVRIDLDDPGRVEDFVLPRGVEGALRRIFASPVAGQGVLVVTRQNEHMYLSRRAQKFRILSRLRHTPTVSVAWRVSGDSPTAILSTNEGEILEVELESGANEAYFKRDIRHMRTIWSSPQRRPVEVRILGDAILVATGSEIIEIKGRNERKHQLPDSIRDITVSNSHMAVVLKSGVVFYGTAIDKLTQAPLEGVKHVLMTRYHIAAITSHDLIMVNTLDNSEAIRTPLEEGVRGVYSDYSKGTHWIWTLDTLMELRVAAEEAAVWPVLVRQKRFDEALSIASDSQLRKDKHEILAAYGKAIAVEDPVKGAHLLGKSSVEPLESAALRFVDNPKALAELFAGRLQHTRYRAQQVALTSWLVQLYVSQPDTEDAYVQFLEKHGDKLDAPTVENILAEYGDAEKLVKFWLAKHQTAKAVGFHVARHNWPQALDVLRRYEDEESAYRYAAPLLKHAAQATVESWMRITKLDARRLLPALVEYAVSFHGDPKSNQAARYLRHVLGSQKNPGIEVYNTLVLVYALIPTDDETELLGVLRDCAHEYSDHDFALRVCLQHKKLQSGVFLYTQMGLREDAVAVCLEHGLLDMGTEIAAQITDNESLRRHLLREIAAKMVSSGSPQVALQKLLGLIRVDDLLGLFPDFDTLDELAPEIVRSLEQAKTRLGALSAEMDETLAASREMQAGIADASKRQVLVEAGEPCQLCEFPLATRKFWVFPCQHGFHSDCLTRAIEHDGSQRHRRKLAAGEDNVLGDECILCSESRLNLLTVPLEVEF